MIGDVDMNDPRVRRLVILFLILLLLFAVAVALDGWEEEKNIRRESQREFNAAEKRQEQEADNR
jgi:hypothetical protein